MAIVPVRTATSPIGTTSPNSGSVGNTNSSYAPGAYTTGAAGITQAIGTAYMLNDSDYGGVVLFNTSSAVTVTLNSAVQTNFTANILNQGTGQITLAPTGGYLVNGSSSLTLVSGQGATVFFASRQWIAYIGSQILPQEPMTFNAVAHEWLNSYNALTGLFTATQPAASDLTNGTTGTGAVALAASPALTGIPTAPTAAQNTNTTELATTAFVLGQASNATPAANSGTGSPGTSNLYARGDHVHPNAGTSLYAYRAVTTTYTVQLTDCIVECTSGTFTVTLPTAAGITGQMFTIKNTGTGTITVATTGSQTMDGQTTQTLLQYNLVQAVSNGTNWLIV